MDMPKTTNNSPNHLPKINPPIKANGEPNPAANTHTIANKINNIARVNKFDCLSS